MQKKNFTFSGSPQNPEFVKVFQFGLLSSSWKQLSSSAYSDQGLESMTE